MGNKDDKKRGDETFWGNLDQRLPKYAGEKAMRLRRGDKRDPDDFLEPDVPAVDPVDAPSMDNGAESPNPHSGSRKHIKVTIEFDHGERANKKWRELYRHAIPRSGAAEPKKAVFSFTVRPDNVLSELHYLHEGKIVEPPAQYINNDLAPKNRKSLQDTYINRLHLAMQKAADMGYAIVAAGISIPASMTDLVAEEVPLRTFLQGLTPAGVDLSTTEGTAPHAATLSIGQAALARPMADIYKENLHLSQASDASKHLQR